jgi:cytidine deaminase
MSRLSPKQIDRLIDTAVSARKSAYCPYSRYPVGAAVLTASGRIFAGCNVENASYGLSICAERAAIFSAVGRNQKELKAVCVVAAAAKPCGACRQVMIEFSDKSTPLFIVDLHPGSARRRVTRTTVFGQLPNAFDPISSGLLPANPQNLLRLRQQKKKKKTKSRKKK